VCWILTDSIFIAHYICSYFSRYKWNLTCVLNSDNIFTVDYICSYSSRHKWNLTCVLYPDNIFIADYICSYSSRYKWNITCVLHPNWQYFHIRLHTQLFQQIKMESNLCVVTPATAKQVAAVRPIRSLVTDTPWRPWNPLLRVMHTVIRWLMDMNQVTFSNRQTSFHFALVLTTKTFAHFWGYLLAGEKYEWIWSRSLNKGNSK